MKSVELIIKGRKVIDVGYRPFLLLNAMYHDIPKIYAFNVREDDKEMIRVRMQGEDDIILQYIDFIRCNFPEYANVEEIMEGSFEGHVMDADKFLQLLQFEQINKGIPSIISIDKKQDSVIGILKEVHRDTSATVDVLKEVREDTSVIRMDISALKRDTYTTVDVLEEKYELLSREIAEIKADLSVIKAKVS